MLSRFATDTTHTVSQDDVRVISYPGVGSTVLRGRYSVREAALYPETGHVSRLAP